MNSLRPSKKQKLVLDYIAKFISEHGYGPSYREIQTGCCYKSVATVAKHIDELVSRGWLRKRSHRARSIEVVVEEDSSETIWLRQKLDRLDIQSLSSDQKQAIVQTMELLELDELAIHFQKD